MKNTKVTYTGSLFTTLLQIAFIVLKLCKVIDWSWLWILAPTWIPLGILVICSIVCILLDNRI